MTDIQLTESAIITKLQEIPQLKKVDSYQGNIEEAVKSTLTHPSALCVYGGADPDTGINADSVKSKVRVSFSIFVIGKNLRGEKESSADVRTILDLIRGKLHGFRPGKVVLTWQGESLELMTTTGVCAYEQMYQYTDYLVQ